MRVSLTLLILVGLTVSSAGFGQEEEKPEVSESHNYLKLIAQKAAIPSLKGEEKFILREKWWSGNLEPGKAELIQLQLFRRNSYKFWLVVPSRDGEPLINMYDGEGNLADTEVTRFDRSNMVAATFSPESTGVYYLRISLKTSIDDSQNWAVIYAYR